MSTATITHDHETDRDVDSSCTLRRPTPGTTADAWPSRPALGAPMVMGPGSFAAHATRRLLHDVSAHRRAR